MPVLRQPRQSRDMQAEVDMHWHRTLVLPARRRNCRIDHPGYRYFEFGCDAQQQTEIVAAHVGRNRHNETVAGSCCATPYPLELLAHKVGRT